MTQPAGRVLAAWAYSEASDPAVIRHLHSVLEQLECDPSPLASMDPSKRSGGPYPQSPTPPTGYALCLGCGTVYPRADACHDCHE
jgi:hypothetical protein